MTPSPSRSLAQTLAIFVVAVMCMLAPVAIAQATITCILKTKAGVNVSTLKPPVLIAQPSLKVAWKECDAGEPLITSGNDSSHRVNSWHGKDLATDLRSVGLSTSQIRCLVDRVPTLLPKPSSGRYVFIFEPDSKTVTQHFHFHFNDGSI